MRIINFELPEILWKVTKTYLSNEVPYEFSIELMSKDQSWYFKDENLAHEFLESFENDDEYETVTIIQGGGHQITYDLKVVAYIERIETLNLIPNVVDF